MSINTKFPLFKFIPICVFLLLTLLPIFSCRRGEISPHKTLAFQKKEMGDSCLEKGNYNEAMGFYIDAIKVSEGKEDQDAYVSSICNIGVIRAMFNDLDGAYEYFNKALQSAELYNNKRVMSICAINLMLISMNKREVEKMRKWRTYLMVNSPEDKEYLLYWDNYTKGLIALGEGETELARKHLDSAYQLAGKNQWDPELQDMIMVDYGTYHLKNGTTDSALAYYKKALSLNRSLPNQQKVIFQALIDIYNNIEEKDSLLKYQTLLLEINDSVYNQNDFNMVKYLLHSYEEDKHEKNLYKANLRFEILLIIAGSLLILIICIIFLYNKLKKTGHNLMNQNKTLIKENEISKKWRERYYSLEDEYEKLKDAIKQGKDCTTKSSNQIEPISLNIPEVKEISDDSDKTILDIENHDKYQKIDEGIKMSPSQTQKIISKIMRIVDDGRTIFDPDFSINTLASELKINSKYVSWAIRQTYQMNFRSFVAKYRVNEVCRRITSNEFGNLTLAAIAEDCGFKSVNNFILVFKKETGMTPAQFKKRSKTPTDHDMIDNNDVNDP